MVSTKLYLDSRKPKEDGTSSVKLRISVKGAGAFIPLDVWIVAEQWDPVRCLVRKNCSNYKKLNEYLQRRKSQIDDCIRDLILDGKLVKKDARGVRDLVVAKLYGQEPGNSFLDYYLAFVNKHESRNTRIAYKSALNAIKRFEPRISELSFEDITKTWLEDFRNFLLNNGCKSMNSVNNHLHCIRAAFNAAIDDELTSVYPFRKLKFRMQQTRKRCLSAEQLLSIFNASVIPVKQKYIDAFKLMFLLIGINTADLCTLTKEDVNNGRLTYSRAKTRRLYDIKIEPEALELIEKYKGEKYLLSFCDRCKTYRNWVQYLNRNISDVMPGVTTYYARHSWATIAASLDIPKETIAAALGHGGHSVTDIYINFDQKKVDEANRKVIDFVLYGKRS